MDENSGLDGEQVPAASGQPTGVPRILILFSDLGEGHASTARTLVNDIRAEKPGAEVILANGVEVLGRFLRWFMRDLYRWQLSRCQRLYGFAYGLFRRVRLFRALGALLMGLLGSQAVLRLVLSHSPDLVISTDARLNAVLGQLRRAGRLKVPVYATLTDLGGLEFWTHKGVDLHLVMDPSCLAPVERIAGQGAARVVRPLVASTFFCPLTRAEARAMLGLPLAGKMVLVSGGGWGVGDLEGAVQAVLTLAHTTAVCATGRNNSAKSELEGRFAGESRLKVLGFTSQMNELIAACDAVIHGTAGVTYLEAAVRGRPVIAYRPPRGHAAVIASALAQRLGQPMVQTQAELREALVVAFSQPEDVGVAARSAPLAASAILEARPRVKPVPSRRVWGVRLAALAVLVMLVGAWTFLTDEPYPVLAHALHLDSVTFASDSPVSVGLVIRTTPDLVPRALADLASYQDRASFAYVGNWPSDVLRAIEGSGSQVLPSLRSGSVVGWVHTRRTLAAEAMSLGVSRPTAYLPPHDGFTLSQYLLARSKGALPVSGETELDSRLPNPKPALRGGSLLVVDLDSSSAASIQFLEEVLTGLKSKGLVGVPLDPQPAPAPPAAGGSS